MKTNIFDFMECDTLFFCKFCNEEYVLPEDTDECPICMMRDIQEVA